MSGSSTKQSLVVVLVGAALVACGPPGTSGPGPKPITLSALTEKAAVTPVGTAVDDATTAVIGAAGGSLTTTDGMLTLTVEPGTVPDGTMFSAQPITNNAPGGFGTGFRLSKPDAVQFAKPVTLSFRFLPSDLVGTAPSAFRIAKQRAGGTWQVFKPAVDMAKQTLTVTTTTFSDWAPLFGYQLLPRESQVRTKKALQLYLKWCRVKEYPDPVTGGTLSGIGIGECNKMVDILTENWSVNGVTGGNSTLGTITGKGSTGLFTAPDKAPSPDTVTVSVEVPALDDFSKEVVLTNIRIVDFDGYVGNLRVRAKGTSSGDTIVMTAAAKLRFLKEYSDPGSANFTLLADESPVTVSEWRLENSSRVCTKAGTPIVFPTPAEGLTGGLDLLNDPPSYGLSGMVSLRVPASCRSKSTGSVTSENMDGLAFVFGTGVTSTASRPMPDREFLEEEDLGLNATFGTRNGVVVTQSWELLRSFGE
ncbi:MAG: hypothetical protein JNJ54_07925 [Myxococcaceae bacterium]|nr:hypothetical protein [Myxococcaceae bacterium]